MDADILYIDDFIKKNDLEDFMEMVRREAPEFDSIEYFEGGLELTVIHNNEPK